MYKTASKIFGLLTVLFGILFAVTKFASLKLAVFKATGEDKQLAVGANNNLLKKLMYSGISFFAPMYVTAKIKTILKDHKKAQKRRKLFSVLKFAFIVMRIMKRRERKALLKG